MQCPLCGVRFERWEQQGACRPCPLARGCRLIRCPRCGYEWADESALVNWVKRHVAKHDLHDDSQRRY